jgi:hypothetical protein
MLYMVIAPPIVLEFYLALPAAHGRHRRGKDFRHARASVCIL